MRRNVKRVTQVSGFGARDDSKDMEKEAKDPQLLLPIVRDFLIFE